MPLVLVLGDQRVPIDRALCVGAEKSCDVIVSGLASKHARLELGDEWTVVRAEGESEVIVNDVRVASGEARVLLPGNQIQFGPVVAKVAYEETNVPMKTSELALAAINRVRELPRIVVVAGKPLGAHLDLAGDGQAVRFGRGRDCDWVLEDDSLSRAHARFVLRGGRVLVRDLESARGTFMGAARLDPQKDATWSPSVSLRLGGVVLALVLPTALDEAIADVIALAPAEDPIPTDAPSPTASAPTSTTASAPIASASKIGERKIADDRELRVRIVAALGVVFIAGCIGVLLWVLGVFAR